VAKRGGGRRKQSPALSLRGVYGARLDALRASYEGQVAHSLEQALEAGANELEIARIYARQKRRAAETDYQIMIREYRREVSRLRKAGLVSKEVKATTARPDKGLFQRIINSARVARGEQRAVKVGKKKARELREAGYETRGDKVLLSPEFRMTKAGHIERRRDGFAASKRVYLSADPATIEATVDRLFNGLAGDELVSIEVWDGLSEFYLPKQRKQFLARLLGYQPPRNGLRYVTLLRMREDEIDAFAMDRTRERLEAQRQRGRARERSRRRSRGGSGVVGVGAHRFTPTFPKR
jgi:hypothetical protein